MIRLAETVLAGFRFLPDERGVQETCRVSRAAHNILVNALRVARAESRLRNRCAIITDTG
ncbi:hypothetical protein [Novosphingobium sp.]|uniref:hypothetical protein n=1 Tax=Novosphingobium sp. TaxID=1874826 RepID=UPI0033417BB4